MTPSKRIKALSWSDLASILTIAGALVLGVAMAAIANHMIGDHDDRIEKLEEDQERLIRVESDVKWIKEHLGGGH